jgi:hypothetical protein
MGLMDIKLQMSSAYHPQIDGQTERINQYLKMYLRCSDSATPKLWVKWLPMAKLWYNSANHSSLKCSPFKALYGVDPSIAAVPDPISSDNKEVAQTLEERKLFADILKEQLTRAQNRMKLVADNKCSKRQFQVGEQVLLKLQPYVQSSVVRRPCPKLALKYFGPYTILEKVGSVAYKLELPSHSLIHPVFHVSQLKQYTPDHAPVFADLPSPPKLDLTVLEPEVILERRLTKKGNSAVTQVKVKWSSLPDELATWEDHDMLKARYPTAAA